MTNELEKTFFDMFGIKPKDRFKGCTLGAKYYSEICKEETCKGCDCEIRETLYPQVTDRILLGLFVIMTRYTDIVEGFDSIQELKEFVLKDLIYSLTQPERNIVKQQVRTLFEAGS